MLRAARHDTDVVAPEEVHGSEEYDAVVLGSAVYAGRWLAAARNLALRLGPGRAVWLFSSGAAPDGRDPADVAGLQEGTAARGHRFFAGRLERARLSAPERALVRVVGTPDGDRRDWAAVRAWAEGIAAELRTETRPGLVRR